MNEKTIFSPFYTAYHISKIHMRLNSISRAKKQKRLDQRQKIKDLILCLLVIGLMITTIVIIVNVCAPPGWEGKIDW